MLRRRPRLAEAPPLEDPERLRALDETELLDTLPPEALERLARLAARLLGTPVALVSLVTADRHVVAASSGLTGRDGTRPREVPMTHSFCRHVVERDGPLVVEDARVAPGFEDHPGTKELEVVAYAGMPLRTPEGLTLGSLCAVDSRPRHWARDDLDALADLAATVMVEVELRRATHRLAREARTDPLTGLLNRRAWDEEAPRELGRADRFGHDVVVALLDLDRFKRYNDHHGHAAGDRLLAEVSALWAAELRDSDLLARLGGEEFAVLLPGVALDPAFDVVERLRGVLQSGVTCSAGIAKRRAGEALPALLARADAALYRAKASGRDASNLAA